jgi:hypothetical protein
MRKEVVDRVHFQSGFIYAGGTGKQLAGGSGSKTYLLLMLEKTNKI